MEINTMAKRGNSMTVKNQATDATKYGVLPCPFCGSMHIFIKDSEEAFEDRSVFVWCEDCGAMVSSPDGETLDEKGNVIIPKTREAYVQHTIEAWNRRA